MNRRFFLGVLGLGEVARRSDAQAAEPDQAAALTVRIVPTSNREKVGQSIELYRPSQHFHVVVTNVSREPIRLWKEWCSWGYFNLSFRVTDGEGDSVEVKKQSRGWDSNYPDLKIIPPGGHDVREVTFDPATWKGLTLPEAHHSKAVLLRAIYEIQADDKTKKHGVWTGLVGSPEEPYELWR